MTLQLNTIMITILQKHKSKIRHNNNHSHTTNDGGQAMGEELTHV